MRASLESNVNTDMHNALHFHMANRRLLTKDLRNDITVSSMYNRLGLYINHYSNGVSSHTKTKIIFWKMILPLPKLIPCNDRNFSSLWRWWPWTVPGSFTLTRWPRTALCTWLIGSSAVWAKPLRMSWMKRMSSLPSVYVDKTSWSPKHQDCIWWIDLKQNYFKHI